MSHTRKNPSRSLYWDVDSSKRALDRRITVFRNRDIVISDPLPGPYQGKQTRKPPFQMKESEEGSPEKKKQF